MTSPDCIMALFYAVDQEMLTVPQHPAAQLYPSEVVTLTLLFAIACLVALQHIATWKV